MGRSKANKPKKIRPATLPSILSAYDRSQLWDVLTAAGASPTTRQRWTSVGYLVDAFLSTSRFGSSVATSSVLPGLLKAVSTHNPGLSSQEDFVAADPRHEVQVRVGERLLRLTPGNVERPVADIDRYLAIAPVVDDELRALVGFGISELLEVCLGYMHQATESLSPSWPPSRADDALLGTVKNSEVEAAQRLNEQARDDTRSSSAHALALDWVTSSPAEVRFTPSSPSSLFGRTMRIVDGGEIHWLPLAFLPEALGSAVSELIHLVADRPGIRERFARTSAAEVRRLLWSFADLILGSEDRPNGPLASPRNEAQWIATFGAGHAIVVQLEADFEGAISWGPKETPEAVSCIRAQKSSGVLSVKLPDAVLTLPAHTEAFPLIVTATANHSLLRLPRGTVAMSIEDLRWIASSSDSRDDLLNFCRELSRPDVPELFGFETINVWEWWRANGKTLFAGGRSPSFMTFDPHAGQAEWERARTRTPLEESLARLDLPPARELFAIEDGPNSPTDVFLWLPDAPGRTYATGDSRAADAGQHTQPDIRGWSVHVDAIPVAVTCMAPEWTKPLNIKMLHDLAGALTFGFRQLKDDWRDMHLGTGSTAYRIDLLPTTTMTGTAPLKVRSVNDDETAFGPLVRVQLEVNPDTLAELGDANPEAIRVELAKVLLAILNRPPLGAEKANTFRSKWLAAPPTMTIRSMPYPTSRNDLNRPLGLDQAHISTSYRMIAERLASTSATPGRYTGEEAKQLDGQILAPTALEVLNGQLASYPVDQLVQFGMEQLSRASDEHGRTTRAISESAQHLKVEWDPVDRINEFIDDNFAIRRSNEMLVEAALRQSPGGADRVDDVAWSQLLAAAFVYFQATLRSEQIHYQITPSAITITPSFEIQITSDLSAAGTNGVDMAAFGRERAAQKINDQIGDVKDAEVDPGVQAAVDEALIGAFGATRTDLESTLFALSTWPLAPTDPDVAVASYDAVLDYAVERMKLSSELDGVQRIKASLELITSRAQALQADDWKPWQARSRKRRLLVQPVPELSDGTLVIAPHFLLAALSVYIGNFSQGQLPWSQPQPPSAVEKALADFRARKNTLFEKKVAALMRTNGWTTVENIRETKPERLGLVSLQTEIDCVAGRADSATIWLLEAKDPADVFAARDVRRAIDKFYTGSSKDLAYVDQLKRKHADLAPHASAVAAALKLPPRPTSDPYVVKTRFVTARPTPAAYVPGPFPFIRFDALIAHVSQSE